jgi:hypothetical protein
MIEGGQHVVIGRRLRKLLRTPPGEILSALTIVGVVLYSVTWFAYRGLYAEFGLEASDVGLTYSSILTSAALGSVMLLTGTIAVLFLLGLLLGLEGEEEFVTLLLPEKIAPPLRFLINALVTIIGLVLGLIVLSATFYLTPRAVALLPDIRMVLLEGTVILVVGLAVFSLLAVLTGALAGSLAAAAMSRLPSLARLISRHVRSILPFLLFSVSVLLLLAAVMGPYYLGHRIGEEISQGKTEGLAKALVIRWMLDVQVERVDVTWLDEKATCGNLSLTNVIFLGGADGTTILYDPGSQTVCRTPTSSLQMTSRPNS